MWAGFLSFWFIYRFSWFVRRLGAPTSRALVLCENLDLRQHLNFHTFTLLEVSQVFLHAASVSHRCSCQKEAMPFSSQRRMPTRQRETQFRYVGSFYSGFGNGWFTGAVFGAFRAGVWKPSPHRAQSNWVFWPTSAWEDREPGWILALEDRFPYPWFRTTEPTSVFRSTQTSDNLYTASTVTPPYELTLPLPLGGFFPVGGNILCIVFLPSRLWRL